jgi:hypothetical protein
MGSEISNQITTLSNKVNEHILQIKSKLQALDPKEQSESTTQRTFNSCVESSEW